MAIFRKKVSNEVFEKAQMYLRQTTQKMPDLQDNEYFYNLEINGGADDGLHLDALLCLANGTISVIMIWVFTKNAQKGILSARNRQGETGSYAKLLAVKYINHFLEYLDTVDIETNTDRDVTVTPELVERVEREIDETFDMATCTEADILRYGRIELTASAEAALRWFFQQLGVPEYTVCYNAGLKGFLFSVGGPYRVRKLVGLADVVNRKWERGESLSRALIGIVGDMLQA